MRSLKFMCAFCLFATVQGYMFDRAKLKNYYKCWTYMNCISEGPMARKMENCISNLKPGDWKLLLEYFDENYHKCSNKTVPGVLSEYCHMDGDEQQDLYKKIMDSIRSLEKVVRADKHLTEMFTRSGEAVVTIMFFVKVNPPTGAIFAPESSGAMSPIGIGLCYALPGKKLSGR